MPLVCFLSVRDLCRGGHMALVPIGLFSPVACNSEVDVVLFLLLRNFKAPLLNCGMRKFMKTYKVNLDGKIISQAALFVVIKSGSLPQLTV